MLTRWQLDLWWKTWWMPEFFWQRHLCLRHTPKCPDTQARRWHCGQGQGFSGACWRGSGRPSAANGWTGWWSRSCVESGFFFHTEAIFSLTLLVLHIFPAFHVSLEEVGHVGEVPCGRNGAVLDPVAAAAGGSAQVGCCGQGKAGTADLSVRAEELF